MSAMVFEYRAVDKDGRRCRGTARAANRELAYRQVVSMGITPVSLRMVGGGTKLRSGRVRLRDIAQLTYQLGVLIDARIPIGEGLQDIAEQETNQRLRCILTDIAARVQAGQHIASAMAEHRKVFGDAYVESIHAAEQTGNMVKVLTHLSEMLERQDEANRAVKSALTYPIVVVSTLTAATTFLIVFAVPKFAKMFAGKGLELPFLTRALMAFGQSIQHFWWVYILATATLVILGRRAWRVPTWRARIDGYLHRLPFVGRILRGLAISRFARVLGLSLSSGIGLIDALEMSGKASGRPMLIADTTTMIEQVRAGGRLSDVLAACGYFPPFAKRMIAAGEQTGEMPRMCDTIARQYERETTMLTKNIGTVIEPILVVLIAAVVLVVALAIFLPMWDMVRLVS